MNFTTFSTLFFLDQGLPMLGSILMSLIAQDKDDFNNLSIILSFCRHCGEEYAGLVPKSILTLAEVSLYQIINKLNKHTKFTPNSILRNIMLSCLHRHCSHPIDNKI